MEAQADRAARLQAGARRRRGDGRGRRSESPVLQTESATVGEVISGTTLSALPLNGRNTGQLSLLLPGVVTPNPSTFTGDPQLRRRPAVRERQPRADQQLHDRRRRHERVDRQPRRLPAQPGRARARSASRPTTTRADTGNVAGAVISNVIKSGSNLRPRQRLRVLPQQRHGRELLGEQPLARRRSRSARQDIYGGTLGGPLVKNKLFFFGNYQGTRFDAPGSETISVAPEAWRRGDLSSVTATIKRSGHRCSRSPATRFRPAGSARSPRAILNNPTLYPLPNRTVSAASPATSSARR